jgi:large subunit ribosomal protein L31
MKADIHPEYKETTVQCTCGAIYQTRSTVADLRIGICGACHPFFTGEQRFVDTAGRVDKFAQRYGSSQARRGTKPRREVEPQAPKRKKEKDEIPTDEAEVAEVVAEAKPEAAVENVEAAAETAEAPAEESKAPAEESKAPAEESSES